MRFHKLKYLLVFICIFSIMESTGISVLSLLTRTNICQTDCQLTNDDEGTSESNEIKESKLKELWADGLDLTIPSACISLVKFNYTDEQHTAHLAWAPPVPTPPPNFTV